MRIVFHEQAWEDYIAWQDQDDKIVQKINAIIENIFRTPFEGLGKPEPLKHDWSGWWSRRITSEHRLVYRVVDQDLLIAQCRFHY